MIEAESHALHSSATLNTGMPVLSFVEVSKNYLADGLPIRALSGVSLQVEQGEFVALVGRSGCGKSTLLNLAGAMDFPTSGQVLLDGAIDIFIGRLRPDSAAPRKSWIHLPVVSTAAHAERYREH